MLVRMQRISILHALLAGMQNEMASWKTNFSVS